MKELTTSDFQSTIAKGKTVVDFWAPWCPPCRMMAPVFEAASKEHTGITFAKVNTDEHGEISNGLGIRGIPTLIFFKDGEEVGRHVGFADKRQMEAKIKEAFGEI